MSGQYFIRTVILEEEVDCGAVWSPHWVERHIIEGVSRFLQNNGLEGFDIVVPEQEPLEDGYVARYSYYVIVNGKTLMHNWARVTFVPARDEGGMA